MITIDGITFDTDNFTVIISEDILRIDLTVIYSRSVDWLAMEDKLKFGPPMRYDGYAPIPGGYSGATFFMYNQWKLVVNTNTTAMEGVLYSENYETAYWTAGNLPIYPVTVSATVNTVFKEVGVSGLTNEESERLFSTSTTEDVYGANLL